MDQQSTIDNMATMEQLVSNTLVRSRFYAMLLGIFAAVAVTLALIGIGATRWQMIGLVLRQMGLLTVLGIATGLAASVGVTRYLADLLYGVTALDPTTLILVSLTFAVGAALAAFVPARRTAYVDPLVALRHE